MVIAFACLAYEFFKPNKDHTIALKVFSLYIIFVSLFPIINKFSQKHLGVLTKTDIETLASHMTDSIMVCIVYILALYVTLWMNKINTILDSTQLKKEVLKKVTWSSIATFAIKIILSFINK